MGLVDPACDRFDLGKLDFHLPGGPAQSTVPPTQSTVRAAQSTVELTETINMVHRVLFRPPTEYLVWIFARRGAPVFFRVRRYRSGRRLILSFCDFRVQLGRIRVCVPQEAVCIRIYASSGAETSKILSRGSIFGHSAAKNPAQTKETRRSLSRLAPNMKNKMNVCGRPQI